MTALVPPLPTRVIGYAVINGQQVPVMSEINWYRYWANGIYDRIGGAVGSSTDDLSASQFEDAGIEEAKALIYANHDAISQANEVASLREELATLRQRMEAIEQGVSL